MNPVSILIIFGIFVVFKLFMSKGSLKSEEAKKIMVNGGKIIDVRSPLEYKSSHVKGSINIQHSSISNGIKKAKLKKDTPIILYCASGSRSSVALSQLRADGYQNLYNAGTQSRLEKLLR